MTSVNSVSSLLTRVTSVDSVSSLLTRVTSVNSFLPSVRCPWGEESLLREDNDEALWFFGPQVEQESLSPSQHNHSELHHVDHDDDDHDDDHHDDDPHFQGDNNYLVGGVRQHHSGRQSLE